jgi:hypothetical protein
LQLGRAGGDTISPKPLEIDFDQAKGTISQHRGNIFTPHVAEAAFNSPSAKAKPMQAVPSPLSSSAGDQSV